MSAERASERLWVFPRRMVEDHVGFTVLLWLLSLVIMAGLIGGIAYFNSISGSVWDQFASSTPHIFVAFMCGYVAHTFLPAYIAQGYTRQEFAAQSAIFVGIFTLAVTAMITVGYLLEYVAFGLIGWPRDITTGHAFTSSTQVHLIGFEFGMTFLVWSLAGLFIGASFYRSEDFGWFSIAIALVPISLVSMAFDRNFGPFDLVRRFFGILPTLPLWLAALLGVLGLVVAAVLPWLVMRDTPVRTKTA